jgi:DNA-binding GntR family transcriptional regulator
MTQAVQHQQLHEVIAERVRTAIISGRFKSGQWLRLRRIAEDLGVSQMPVREALKQLATEGVVEHVPYRGVRVVGFSAQDVADLYAQRSFLESRAARAAAESITPAELAELAELLSQMEESSAFTDLVAYCHLNRRLHQVIYQASRRDYLVHALGQVWSAFPTVMMSYYAQTSNPSEVSRHTQDMDEHNAIIKALGEGDGESAETLMRQHIERNCQELLGVLEEAATAVTAESAVTVKRR